MLHICIPCGKISLSYDTKILFGSKLKKNWGLLSNIPLMKGESNMADEAGVVGKGGNWVKNMQVGQQVGH